MLSVREITASGYRSIRGIRFPVDRLSVFVGANGVGKTNLYRALQLLQGAAAGTLTRDLASEGGMDSALWAGKRTAKQPARIRLAVDLAAERDGLRLGYDVEAGLVQQYEVRAGAGFLLEPQVETETLLQHTARRPATLLNRTGPPASPSMRTAGSARSARRCSRPRRPYPRCRMLPSSPTSTA